VTRLSATAELVTGASGAASLVLPPGVAPLFPGADLHARPPLGSILDGLSALTREIQEQEARLGHAKRRRGLLLALLREQYGEEEWLFALEMMRLPLETARGEMWVARKVPEPLWDLGFSYSALKAAAALPGPELAPVLARLHDQGRTTVAAVNAELRERAIEAAPSPPDPAEGPTTLTVWLRGYALREWAGRFGPETAQEMADGFAAEVLEWSRTNGPGGARRPEPSWYTGP